jgi:Flp pilus assembly protein TadG
MTMTAFWYRVLSARRKRFLWRDQRASQVVEFAVALPLLVVFVVGIFDFSGAFTLKQKLANAAREGARAAASGPANDLANPSAAVPASVSDSVQVIKNYLDSAAVNDCGLPGTTPAPNKLSWTYTAKANGCPGNGIKLTINRACITTQTIGASTVDVVNTCVQIQYSYKWQFNKVITLLATGANYPGITDLTTSAIAMNEN